MVHQVQFPLFPERGQFFIDVGALGKETAERTARLTRRESPCLGQKPGERREGPGGDDVDRKGGDALEPLRQDGDVGPGHARGLAQESGLALVGLDQVNLAGAHHGEHQAGKARAAAEVDQDAPARRIGRRQEREELGRVEYMALPEPAQGSPADEVNAAVPLLQQRGETAQALRRFT